MGIRTLDLQLLAKTMAAAKIVFPGSTMLEMGDQMLEADLSGKTYFTEKGVEHTSIDRNGEHGALKLDLAEPVDLGQFDIVTNFGTAEHVSNQRTFFRNMHDACRPGGIMVHTGPWTDVEPGRNHGVKHGKRAYGFSIRYSLRFFREMADSNEYLIADWRTNYWLGYVGFVCPTDEKRKFQWRH